jgi:Ca2+/Na+ antiporter
MGKNRGSALQGVIVTLLVISVYLLHSYNEELSIQRTLEQTAQLEQQTELKKNIDIMKTEHEKIVKESLIAMDWSEIKSLSQLISKVIALQVYLLLLIPMVLIALISFMLQTMNPI